MYNNNNRGIIEDSMLLLPCRAWLFDVHDSVVARLSQKLGAIINLDHQSAEPFQVWTIGSLSDISYPTKDSSARSALGVRFEEVNLAHAF